MVSVRRRIWLLPAIAIFLSLYHLYHNSRTSTQAYTELTQTKDEDKTDETLRLVPFPENYPVTNFIQLPSGPAKQLPRVQFDFPSESAAQKKERLARLNTIKDAFIHTWKGYKKFAWGYDELMPVSGQRLNIYGGWGATLVDSLGTLWMMGLKQDFEEAVEAVEKIDFSKSSEKSINVFEVTIRYLGGLLSAYDMSEHKYPVLLAKAVELADVLYMVFDTENRMPATRWNWKESAKGIPVKAGTATLLAELGSLNVEFTRLAQLTGDHKWFDAVERPTDLLYRTQNSTKIPGLWPLVVNTVTGDLTGYNSFTFGGMADSAYEYLTKEFVLLGGLDERFRDMYSGAITAAKKFLFFRPFVPGERAILISGNAVVAADNEILTDPSGQHLSCFTGGMLALSAKIFERHDELEVAKQLVDGCIWAYNSTPSGLMPETFSMTPCDTRLDKADLSSCEWSQGKWYAALTKSHGEPNQQGENEVDTGRRIAEQKSLLPGYSMWNDPRYILRPEAIESVFYYYRITGDRMYFDEAWRMWTSIDSACRTPIAYAASDDVRVKSSSQIDRMESFWLAETLKYFFLLYSDPNDWSLDDWVLNTEAHLLRRPRAGELLIRA